MKNKNILLPIMLPMAMILMSHSIWIESSYKGVPGDDVVFNFFFGEFEKGLKEKGAMVDGMKDFKASYILENGKPTSVPLRKTINSYEGKFVAAEAGFYQILAIDDEREVQDWTKHGLDVVRPIEYQRSSFTAFSDKKTQKVNIEPYFFFDIIPDYSLNHKGEICSIFEKEKTLTATIFFNKRRAFNTEIKIYTPDKRMVTLTSDKLGRFSFDVRTPGTYLITSVMNEQIEGEFKGKKFKYTRHHASTTVNVE